VRSEILKALEFARNGGIIGHSLDAEVIVYSNGDKEEPVLKSLMSGDTQKAEDVLIISQLASPNGEKPQFLWELEEARRAGMEGASAQILDGGRTGWGYYSKMLDSIIAVFQAQGGKCKRCWKYEKEVEENSADKEVCPRCAAVLASGAAA
jgi:isoleucyl-tRNA synthetase